MRDGDEFIDEEGAVVNDEGETMTGGDETTRQATKKRASTGSALGFRSVVRVHGTGPTAVRALGPIDLDVADGEFVAVMGPSGSGKSTFLGLAGALDLPTEGRVTILGTDLAQLGTSQSATLRRRAIGFVFQELNLLPGLTALENVALPLELDGVSSNEARRQSVEALARVQMERLSHRFPDDLSGGEQQRVAIARAMVGERRLLLADEPTGALDSVTGEVVMRCLREHVDRGRTVVLVTHDSSHAAWADRVVFLRDGQILRETRSSRPFLPRVLGPRP
ncbi:MAG: ABC transporter ATP-binding protein [Candidatus Eisenbacteria bacterium]